MIHFLLKRPVAVTMFYMAVVILGYFSFRNLAIEGQPDTELPQLIVNTNWGTTSPEVVQVFLTSPIEESGAQIEGLEEMVSSSRRGVSEVTLKFNRETDMEFAKLDLNERLSKLRSELPPGASQPRIRMTESNRRADEDFMTFAVSGPYNLDELTELFDDYLRNSISSVDGVADVGVQGDREKAVKVKLDREAMDLYGLVPQVVLARVNEFTTNYETNRSSYLNHEYTIVIENTIPSIRDLEETVLTRYRDQLVRLKDVGTVELGNSKVMSYSRLNGNPVLTVSIQKEVGTNVIQTAKTVKQEVEEALSVMPEGFRIEWINDEGEMMEEQLSSVYQRGFWCIVLIVLLLLVFLQSASAAMVITLNIFFSVLITINFMFYFDVAFNIVSLSGLAVGFGMLVDNAIVVLENIFRYREEGKSKIDAALLGAKEVVWPILAATLTTVAAFMCMFLLEDRLSATYLPLSLAVIFSLSASLVVSFTFTPLLSMLIRGSNLNPNYKPGPVRSFLGNGVRRMTDTYGHVVAWTLRHKFFVMFVSLSLFGMYFQIYRTEIDKGGFSFFFNRDDQVGVVVRMPEGAEVETADEVIKQFETPLLEVEGYKDADTRVFSNFAIMMVKFDSEMLRTPYPLALKSRLISVAQRFAGVSLTVFGINSEDNYYSGSTGYESYNSSIRVLGYNYKRLMDFSNDILRSVKKNRRVKSTKLETSRGGRFGARDQTETVLRVNREALRQYDMDISYLMAFLGRNLTVESTSRTKYKGEEMSLEVKFDDADDFDIKALENLTITTPAGQKIRLADTVTLEERKVASGIDRKDQQYMVNVMWDYKGSTKRARRYTESIFNSLDLPSGFKAELEYDQFLSEDETRNLRLVAFFAVLIVFMIIAALYESIIDPLIIFLTVPLAFIGVSWIYNYTGNSFDSTAWIGLVILAGIIVNNSILLVSQINLEVQNMEKTGLTFTEAIIKASKDRLRPILLTAITTIVGLLPLLEEFVNFFLGLPLIGTFLGSLGVEAGGNLENQGLQSTLSMFSSLSRSTVGGMLTATFATLLVMPVVYAVFYRLKQWTYVRINEMFKLVETGFRMPSESRSKQ